MNNFNSEEAKSLITRFGGFSQFSEDLEKHSLELIDEKESYSLVDVAATMLLASLNKSYPVNLKALVLSINIEEIDDLFNSEKIQKYLPINVDESLLDRNSTKIIHNNTDAEIWVQDYLKIIQKLEKKGKIKIKKYEK